MSSNQFDLVLNLISNQDCDLISNQINNILICFCKVKKFLQKNFNEQKIITAQIYNLSKSILQSLISRFQNAKHNKHNQIL